MTVKHLIEQLSYLDPDMEVSAGNPIEQDGIIDPDLNVRKVFVHREEPDKFVNEEEPMGFEIEVLFIE